MNGDGGVGLGAGPVAGLRVLELCDEKGALAGKLLADMGAEVIKLEPPGGDPTRAYGPFVDDVPDPERSLWFWYYNTSKRGATLNLERDGGRDLFRRLIATADIFIESEPRGRLAALGLDYPDLAATNSGLIMVSITPFGISGPQGNEAVTDLTILADGGPVWSCGYDDHSLPPVRGGGNQGYHTGCHYAVMALLVALLHRDRTGEGQHIDVNMHAALNVTTEGGSYNWLVARETVQRQTGRHATVKPTQPTQVRAADGRYAMSGVTPRSPEQFRAVYEWMQELNLLDEFPGAAVLEIGMSLDEPIVPARAREDDAVRMLLEAGRDAFNLLAARLPAQEFFLGGQERGFQLGIIYSPEEALDNPHAAARGFVVEVEHPEIGRRVRYPGAPYRFQSTPWQIRRRAPLLGEDNAGVYGELGLDERAVAQLTEEGIL